MADVTGSDNLPAESVIPGLPVDWPQQATSRVVDAVDTVRSKTAGPAIRVSRAVVYGLVALILGLLAIPLLIVGATRGAISLIDLSVGHDNAVWITYAGFGTFFCALGLLLWSRRPRGAARG